MPADSFEELPTLFAGGPPDGRAAGAVLLAKARLFASRQTHPVEEVVAFAELAASLLGDVDEATALAVADLVLARADCLPAIAAALTDRRDKAAVAALARAASLDATRLARAAAGSTAEAEAVAARSDLDETTIGRLWARGEAAVERALALNPAVPLGRDAVERLIGPARHDAPLARALLDRAPLSPADRGVLFLAAAPAERRVILRDLTGLAALSPIARNGDAQAAAALAAYVEAAARGRDRPALARILTAATGAAEPLAEAVVADRHGEPLAVALKAVDLPQEIATRVLLLAVPRLGRSAATIRGLVSLYRGLDRATAVLALRLFAGLGGRTETSAPSHAAAPDARRGPSGPGEAAAARRRAGPHQATRRAASERQS